MTIEEGVRQLIDVYQTKLENLNADLRDTDSYMQRSVKAAKYGVYLEVTVDLANLLKGVDE